MDNSVLVLLLVAAPPWLILFAMVLTGAPGTRRVSRVEWRLAAIERRLQLVMDHLGVVDPLAAPAGSSPDAPDVVRLLERGQKIQAIKAYRQATGVGLKEAKDAVEAMASQRGL